MSKKTPKPDEAEQDKGQLTIDEDDTEGRLREMGGSNSDRWNTVMVDQAVQALWMKHADEDQKYRMMRAAISGMMGVGPRDELEGMMVAQLIASHSAAMECYRRAMIGEQSFEGRKENLNQANKLSRTWATLLEALNRHRGKGQQKVTVEHVHVHAGGQAVVGHVEAAAGAKGGGVAKEREEQPRAQQDGDASQPALRGPDPARDGVPIPGDGQWAVPDARGTVLRRSGGE